MKRFLIFLAATLCINFIGLGIGAYLQGNIIENSWYNALNKAPWTPPGWVFGFAWTIIMICYAIFLSTYIHRNGFSDIKRIYILSWLLNVAWSPIFFVHHFTGLSLTILILLFSCILYLFLNYTSTMKKRKLLLIPYMLWLLIAISLNGYVFLEN